MFWRGGCAPTGLFVAAAAAAAVGVHIRERAGAGAEQQQQQLPRPAAPHSQYNFFIRALLGPLSSPVLAPTYDFIPFSISFLFLVDEIVFVLCVSVGVGAQVCVFCVEVIS